ncbi:response regulator [Ohtaekwangia kribbensis]|jgi:two-component system response regulator NreC|uniref:Response regulator n=1 Tax=Ohtaekwangia kribbensis TaxID=688913 RepID=A0ABW3K0E0_9BACT
MIRIGLIEDQLLFRKGMKAIIHEWTGMKVTLEASTGVEAVTLLKEAIEKPDVILLDLGLPTDKEPALNGIDLTIHIRSAYPEIKIIILSVHQHEDYISHLIEQGAHGYLVKDTDPEEVREAIHAVTIKGFYLNERTMYAIQNGLSKKKKSKISLNDTTYLTSREKEILDLVCRQLTAEEIAEKLYISVKTVNGHRNNLLQKTGVRNTAGLVVFALKNNLVDVDRYTL